MPERLRSTEGAFTLFDAMRFFAALTVVIDHTRHVFLVDSDAAVGSLAIKAFYFFTRLGHQAVLVFFVLSGFWIASTVDRRMGTPDFWRNYLVDRTSRLLIVLAPALLIGAVLDNYGLHVLHGALYEGRLGAAAFPENLGPGLRPTVLLGNLLFLQTVAVPAFGTNGALWSLANEFWYYLWFPALFAVLRYRRLTWALLSLAVGVAAPHLLQLFPVWLFGSAVYFANKHWGEQLALSRALTGLLTAGALLTFLASLIVERAQLVGFWPGAVLIGVTFALLMFALLLHRPHVGAWSRPFAAYGARSSFSLYACHFPVLALVVTVINGDHRHLPTAGAIVTVALVILMLVVWGLVFSRLTEARTASLRAWLRRRQQRSFS